MQEKDINELISAFRDCKVPEISSFANTMTRWKTEIINSFIVTNEHGRKINSGIIENRNRTIQMYQAQFQWIYQLETIPKQSALCTE